MQVEFGRLVTALGQAVSEAQRAVAAHAIGNYLAYFRRGPADQDGGAGYAPNTTSILFPPSTGGEEGARVAVPLVTLAHHNAVGLDSVRIKLCAAAAVDEEEKLLLDFSRPGRGQRRTPTADGNGAVFSAVMTAGRNRAGHHRDEQIIIRKGDIDHGRRVWEKFCHAPYGAADLRADHRGGPGTV